MQIQRKRGGTYAELHDRLVCARKILTDLGFRTHGRLEKYENALKRLADAMPDRIVVEFTEAEASNIILMFPEISEFLFVMDALPRSPHLVNHPRFKEIFSGDTLAVDEPNTTPRNTLFELTIAALLELAGLVSSIDAVADVETVFKSIPILIECKRIQNFDKLEARIGEAHHQLVPRLAARGKSSVGIVALSISKAHTEGSKKLTTINPAQMNAAMAELLKMGEQNLRPFWSRYTSFDGVLVHLCVSGKMNGPFVNTQYAMLARPKLSKVRFTFLEAILKTIQDAHN